jgi:hypothetical protein
MNAVHHVSFSSGNVKIIASYYNAVFTGDGRTTPLSLHFF